ncbi:RagB/SusD family nutrient uptake outer membrane protein [Fibrella forsythiae]|uniref:RagB/SusD family nutrient uptake outer membrane protein n=1 Tax=Fibrella forsythiae TaxID=2817061 RepID=A0ABS3JQ84_9BACT|nr:RagB/SusD family nutrient uptake outer membrane protein [Fibrella forsythiae]MBO0952166.1 RagB/SusD family nutrient uptake outer membrane protein [Fibrella forsythiae]
MLQHTLKKFGGIALVGTLLTTILTQCKPSLEIEPRDQISDASLFASTTNADLFLNDVYNQLPDVNNETLNLDQAADNSYVGAEWMWGRTAIYNGSLSASDVPGGPGDNGGSWTWGTTYSRIRKANLFIQKVGASGLPADYKKSRIAEARFLRAFFYHYLWQAYGGVPIITVPLNNLSQGDSINRPRATAADTYKFIADELTAIAGDLPLKVSGNDLGRPTKGAALTLRAWVDLYHASPLRNSTSSVDRWAKAAASAKEVMSLGVYGLFPDYEKLFYVENKNNVEVIFDRQYKSIVKGHQREGREGPAYVNGIQQSWGNLAPTQELVDDYAMDNGKAITEAGSGYNAQDPYKKREKRFYQSIIYDGSVWQGDTMRMRRGINALNEIDLGSASDVSNTGYYGRKTLDERISGQTSLAQSPGGNSYIYFRYADVLLMYAEAQNEAAGPDASVLAAVDAVRSRSSLPTITATYGTVTKDKMREIIRRERRIELAFEDKRWWDVLRWKIANGTNGVLNKQASGMVIERKNGVWTYTPTRIVSKTFLDRMYVFPIPQYVLDQNPMIRAQNGGPDGWVNGQNPGY